VQSHCLLLFNNVRMCNHSFCPSFKNCDCAIVLLVALWKSAIVRNVQKNANLQNALILHSKKSYHTISLWKRVNVALWKSANFIIALFWHIKRAIAHFKVWEYPTLGGFREKVFKWHSYVGVKLSFLPLNGQKMFPDILQAIWSWRT